MKKYMPKLKESLNKNKFTLVVFYGAFAVGKYTVANEFHKKTGYKFFHNHHAYDLAHSLFERKSEGLSSLYENINFKVLEEIAKAGLNTVTTHAYSAKYVSHTGLSDPDYMKKMQRIVEKAGGVAYFIHLKAEHDSLLKRVTGRSRKKFLKLKDPELLRGILEDSRKDFVTSAPVKHNLVIDNTKIPPKKVVDMVIKHFKII